MEHQEGNRAICLKLGPDTRTIGRSRYRAEVCLGGGLDLGEGDILKYIPRQCGGEESVSTFNSRLFPLDVSYILVNFITIRLGC